MIKGYCSTIVNTGICLGLFAGVCISNYVCKSKNCAFFITFGLCISSILTVLNLVNLIQSKSKITFKSVYAGVINAVMDIWIVFMYSRLQYASSLFVCLLVLMHHITLYVFTCHVQYPKSTYVIMMFYTFSFMLYKLWFVEEYGFSMEAIPFFARKYFVKGAVNIMHFGNAIPIRTIIVDRLDRIENAEAASFFGSMIMFAIVVMKALVDKPAFQEEMSKVSGMALPFCVMAVILGVVAFNLRRNKQVDVSKAYPLCCGIFVLLSLMFCSGILQGVWQKNMMEEALRDVHIYTLIVFSIFVVYTTVAYRSEISVTPCRESLFLKMINHLWE
ncbi:hypothetical protein CWI42_080690 [Ordospora colligata]|uniref:Uncharacterized protein n=1 Tax=Ordospora colligata OC4 TaxID=1354746 RepID=A0A0B2UK38_9MICR|nr:uncharacterized protein M896_080700 [Ordospora colligata OC4]KHN69335.1 hypothetical protein M896_080700 [Ordospora colligata OC4]TBU14849.1 hypothetical protein CWI41_080690 [Ordospora colligata]TBU14980.1 hypothetical protein CWI40_080710 [Ordospora colligata]TBU18364.1 hypothetical protein CWI42_080690 [Ordospora colligata]